MVVVSQTNGVVQNDVRMWRLQIIRKFGVLFQFCAFAVLLPVIGCSSRSRPEVVVYCSQDRVYAEPIFADFTRESGIEVKALFDTEAAKTVGLATRLLAEKSRPQCDLFWSNEELRTWQLAARGVLETNWISMGYRARRLVINTNHLPASGMRPGLKELTQPSWRARVAVASPLFGTTATYFLALRQHWGDQRWQEWCRELIANKAMVVNGNSDVVNLVGRGEAWIGLTDSDDVAAGQREGLPIMPLDAADVPGMTIPNTVSLVIRRPHPAAAQRLLEFLRQPGIAKRLVEAHALESAAPVESVGDRLQADYARMVRDLDGATRTLEGIFLK
jgi:iron(III) transport system substrate-binding protein